MTAQNTHTLMIPYALKPSLKNVGFLIIILLACSNVFAQKATGYLPMPDGKYEETRVPFRSTKSDGELPKAYVISPDYFPQPGDQGNMGSCVGRSTGYAFASFYFSAKNQWGKPVNYSKVMSPAYVYNGIRECNCGPDCGSYIADALELLKTKGIVPWETMPYSDDDCTKPMESVFSVAGNYKIKGYNRLANKMNFNEYKQYLSNDVPIIIGVPLGKGFDGIGANSTGIFKCTQVENGGHAMLMTGYDDERKAFKIMNSWGNSWGDQGHVWVDYDCFKLMMGGSGGEAYVVSKDYEIGGGTNNPVVVNPVLPSSETITADQFEIYGYSEEIDSNYFYVSYALAINKNIQDQVAKVIYIFDDPDFPEQYISSDEAPYFPTAYEGPYCLEEMQAIVYLKDGKTVQLTFDGCQVLDEEDNYVDDGGEEYEYIDVRPVVTAQSLDDDSGNFHFDIQLVGLSAYKDQIEKVVYDYNHESFTTRYVTVTDGNDSYKTGYNGWGCLSGLIATIYFDDGTTEMITIDMCDELGW
ncbi:C1 family peptidase [Fluviicola taffensis]|uniref:C1 family peptidase n=1 Tax=Fluviicola taffensis TaxID=191579 RepID=UPI00313805CE